MNFLRLTYYLLVINFKDFGYIFWTIGYPLMLVTIFMATTSNLGGADMTTIEVAVTEDNEYTQVLEQIDFISVSEMSDSTARAELDAENITGYITENGTLIVQSSSFQASVLESVMNQIHQTTLLNVPPENFNFETDFLKSNGMETEPQVVMYYSTIAMVSLYTVFTSMEMISSMRPNLSTMGARFSASPFSKVKYILAIMVAGLFLGLLSNALLIGYLMIFNESVLFNHLAPTLGIILAGNIAGLGLGFIIGLTPRVNINVKSVVPVVFIVGLAFLAGLMGPAVRSVINREIPLINELNPLAHITDTIYRVNLMDNFEGYWTTILFLLGITFVSFFITLIVLRRKQYDHI
ncbi:ABC-2 family transporter protein [Jeotgalicoccus saudimassiliensis]|uniref:ABC-2 family transporter protein n=1 Tax=Jeotgalicoccus saudimassiliensis TaxID=1461582 RepID=A0A078MB35_9STAP|nr:ABC transporter permease [Jeotgalicoccus saudimassiliensis]CEA03500.1 ABC-2 family transporter protein [Jeotgalicoccus saudimassiliensis]